MKIPMKPNHLVKAVPLAALALLLSLATSHAQLEWRISVKFILGASGQMPAANAGFGASSVFLTNNQAVIDNIAFANQILDRTGRGYRFRLTEVRTVSGWSGFFNLPARDGINKGALEAVATSNATTRAQFFWRDDAINVYINNSSSGYCSFPGDGNVIFAGATAYDALIIHECGHFFDLRHTHDTEQFRNGNGTPCNAGCSCAQRLGGDDGIGDTLFDNECWNRAEIAAGNPGANDFQIDNTWMNLMSYHLPQDRFTTLQLDRITDLSNGSRNNVATGRTKFVDRNCAVLFPDGNSVCTGLAGPYRTVTAGVNGAASGSIVLIRTGTYIEPGTINKPLTLRATRGSVTIGNPN
jgi:Pregnancy-associated plasma protein-A